MIYPVAIMIAFVEIPWQKVFTPSADSGLLVAIFIIQIIFIYCLFDWIMNKYFDS